MTLLLSMLLACGEQTEDSGQTGGESEDPKWFEEGIYRNCSYPCGAKSFELTQTGTISDYELVYWWNGNSDERTKRGSCLIGDPITPDETVWEATCDGLEEVIIYSEGFRADVSFIHPNHGDLRQTTWE